MVTKSQFKRDELDRIFANAQFKASIISAISRPATSRPWSDYRASFVNSERIQRGLGFWQKNLLALQRAELKYGVPEEVIVAIIGVETIYGKSQGTYRIIDALTTLAFDYPRRAEFFRRELESYLLLVREQQFDLMAVHGSYAGAIGIPQFMPSTYRRYAIDFNGNNKIDLMHEEADAIGSVANYMQGNGWMSEGVESVRIAVPAKIVERQWIGEISKPRTIQEWSDVGVIPQADIPSEQSARLVVFDVRGEYQLWLVFNNFDVITRYNNSDYYAMSVYQLAEELKAARNANLAN
jgi:membrane-bound lytic murein transglycosylase B